MSEFMRLCLVEAARALREGCSPYPGVGVVLEFQARPLVRAHNGKPGQPHAEITALAEAQTKGLDLSQCILHSNLEPCSNQIGLVHSCAKSIIDSGIREVHVSLVDPYHLIKGKGIVTLREAGVRVIEGEMADQARFQNAAYLHRFCPTCGWEISVV